MPGQCLGTSRTRVHTYTDIIDRSVNRRRGGCRSVLCFFTFFLSLSLFLGVLPLFLFSLYEPFSSAPASVTAAATSKIVETGNGWSTAAESARPVRSRTPKKVNWPRTSSGNEHRPTTSHILSRATWSLTNGRRRIVVFLISFLSFSVCYFFFHFLLPRKSQYDTVPTYRPCVSGDGGGGVKTKQNRQDTRLTSVLISAVMR